MLYHLRYALLVPVLDESTDDTNCNNDFSTCSQELPALPQIPPSDFPNPVNPYPCHIIVSGGGIVFIIDGKSNTVTAICHITGREPVCIRAEFRKSIN